MDLNLQKLAGVFGPDEPAVSNSEMLGASLSAMMLPDIAASSARNLQGVDRFSSILAADPTTGKVPTNPAHLMSLTGDGMPVPGIQPADTGSHAAWLADMATAKETGRPSMSTRVQVSAPSHRAAQTGYGLDDITSSPAFNKRKVWAEAAGDLGGYARSNKVRAALGAMGLLGTGIGAVTTGATMAQGIQERI